VVQTRHLIFAASLALACAGSGGTETTDTPVDGRPPLGDPEYEIPPGSGTIDEFLDCELPGGTRRRQRVTPAEVPWRVSIGMPQDAPKYGSRTDARAAAIAAMRQWERAIQTELSWFRLEFVEKGADAPVRIQWKRRTTGSASGRAGPMCWLEDGRVRAGGRMMVSLRQCPTCNKLTLDEVRMLVAHEFGHVLGLGHCLDCDSAMNYSWHTRDRIFVTQTDVDAVVHLFGRPADT
jgi:hypothetical protein